MIPPRPDDCGCIGPHAMCTEHFLASLGEDAPSSWFVRRWRANSPLINFASIVLLLIGLANVGVGIALIVRG